MNAQTQAHQQPRFFDTVAALTTKIKADGGVLLFDNLRPDLLEPLREEIFALAQRYPNAFPSRNIGGWKSPDHVFETGGPAMKALRDELGQLFFAGRKSVGWAMINRAGSEHARHQHRIASVSGVYYVSPGDPATPTMIEVTPKEKIAIEPVPARLVLFMGDTWHSVPKYIGDEPRLTIAFDVRR